MKPRVKDDTVSSAGLSSRRPVSVSLAVPPDAPSPRFPAPGAHHLLCVSVDVTVPGTSQGRAGGPCRVWLPAALPSEAHRVQ